MLALHAVCLWVASPSNRWSDQQIRDYLQGQGLSSALTADDRSILALPRSTAHEKYLPQIGWRLENLWALAWVGGFDLKPDLRGQFEGPDLRRLVFEWLPGPGRLSQQSFQKAFTLRPTREVCQLEDLMYCAHNAVRSAQLGGATLPPDYDPVSEGGCIHERRHSLTWVLSPGVSWDRTDLNT